MKTKSKLSTAIIACLLLCTVFSCEQISIPKPPHSYIQKRCVKSHKEIKMKYTTGHNFLTGKFETNIMPVEEEICDCYINDTIKIK